MGKHRAKFKEEKDGETQKLKNTVRRLQSDIRKLKSELATYEAAFQKNITFLKSKMKDITLEEAVAGAKKKQNLKQIEDTKEETYNEFKQKWKCYHCQDQTRAGILKLTVITRHDGKFYYRRCNAEKCGYRTDLKPLTDDVEIS